MYHCHIRFYFIGSHNDVFEYIKEKAPLEHFTHSFRESGEPETEAAAQADVLLVDLRGTDADKTLRILTGCMKKEG